MESSSFLKNRYWILRHGKSIPNERGLIVSTLENGIISKYQLCSEGVKQAHLAGELFQKELEAKKIPIKSARISYSPFSRTLHTAKVVASVLNLPFNGPQCKVMEDLRGRYFCPSFELKSHHENYPDILAIHATDPFIQPEGGESVNDIAIRLAEAISEMESEFQGCGALIGSHGDPLQILQTLLNAARESSSDCDIVSSIHAVKVPSILSQLRKFAPLTREL